MAIETIPPPPEGYPETPVRLEQRRRLRQELVGLCRFARTSDDPLVRDAGVILHGIRIWLKESDAAALGSVADQAYLNADA